MITRFTRPAFIFTSPWLLAAAAGLMVIIVVTLAFHNLRLERRLMTGAMLQKAATLMQVLHSGSRASYMNDLRRDSSNNDAWNVHVQRIIDHLSEDPELRFLTLVDSNGKVIAHSDPQKVGSTLVLPAMDKNPGEDDQPRMSFIIKTDTEYGRVFEAVRRFYPVFPVLMPMRPMRNWHQEFYQHNKGRERGPMMRMFPDSGKSGEQYLVIAGLDMTEYDKTLGRLQMQIGMLSMAMLLVGLGGWFSLSAVQGYRVSQKTLDDMQAYTSLLIAKLPVGIIATDADGRITTWNQAVVDLTGIAKSGAIGKKPTEILPEALAAFFKATNPEPGTAHSPAQEESRRIFFGTRRCELLCHPLLITDSEQKYMGRVLLISDVTEIKSLEQRMRESERLAAIGRMAGGVAHEVRNPLSSIKGLALLLKNKFPPGSTEQHTAELLIQETERMNRTITEMLSLTRPAPLHATKVELQTLLQRSLELIRAEAGDNGIEASLAIGEDVLPVLGDVDRLQQVIMNVLLNGMQAMEHGGRLQISARNLQGRSEVELRISDTGKGIAPELLSQVFYPYFTTKKGGTGIGLAISQKLVADHNGSIEIESEQGRGTAVVIRLPVWRETLPPQDGNKDAVAL